MAPDLLIKTFLVEGDACIGALSASLLGGIS